MNYKKGAGGHKQSYDERGRYTSDVILDSSSVIAFLGFLILGIIVGPFMSYKVFPIWGKIIFPIICLLFTATFVDNFLFNLNDGYNRNFIQRYAVPLMECVSYLVFSIMCTIRNGFHDSNGYYHSSFFLPLVILSIFSIAVFAIYIIVNKNNESAGNKTKANPFKVVSILFLIASVGCTIAGFCEGDLYKNYKKFEFSYAREAVHDDRYLTLNINIYNNLDKNILKIKTCNITFLDSTNTKVAVVKETDLPGIKAHETEEYTFYCDFYKKEADKTYWETHSIYDTHSTMEIEWSVY